MKAIDGGTLNLAGDDASHPATGTFSADADSTLRFCGTYSLGAGCKCTGGVTVGGPWLDASGDAGGDPLLKVPSGATTTWTGSNTFLSGTISGPGTLDVPSGATLTAEGDDGTLHTAPEFSDLLLTVEGTLGLTQATGSSSPNVVVGTRPRSPTRARSSSRATRTSTGARHRGRRL